MRRRLSLLIVLLLTTIAVQNGYTAAEPLPQNVSPIYKISTTVLYWNGTGYLPLTVPGDGKTLIMATAGYRALITNVTVLNETKEKCIIRVDYIITKIHGAEVPMNETLSRTFVVDPRTNSFILNGTTAFFPFYVCRNDLKYTYHFGERIEAKKFGDFMVWKNVTYEGSQATLRFEPLYTFLGKNVMAYLCSAVDLEEKKCVKFDPDPSPTLDAGVSSHYLMSIYGIFPGDPLGIFNGPVEVSGEIVKSERTAKLLGARPVTLDGGFNPLYALLGVIILVVGVIAARRAR
ncbi:hypothetical protein [Thermococcus waiotapuensis]|uniref:Uncharacterized protein n=1 Tax=Thermococcus waiotapuensis TaxID=90909 RepID=A0AAE4NWK0_9EURY|nr:hypothetical protein [Thermococcus waiotapuensis]MDV3103995.1 hypothetical protein [Thermococcus waiotapuensis]